MALVPPTVVTRTSIVAAASAGETAVIVVLLLMMNDVAAVAPKATAVAPVKLVPVIVTDVPPPIGPEMGLTAVTVGAAAYVKWSDELVADVPLDATTVMSMVPAEPAGALAVIELVEFTVNADALFAPNFTSVTPVKFAPVMFTDVPPSVGPPFGLTDVTEGAVVPPEVSRRAAIEMAPAVPVSVPTGAATATTAVL